VAKSIKLGQLGAELKKALAAEKEFIKASTEKAVRVAAIKTFSKIIKMTPVGNPDLWVYNHPTRGFIDYVGYLGKPEGYVGGRARSNWFVGQSVSSRVTDSTKDKGAGYVAAALPDKLMGDKTYFYNNLPYIEALEYGHSTQAPLGMVRVSLMGWERALNKAFKEIKWHT
jgi:hypothetical protein